MATLYDDEAFPVFDVPMNLTALFSGFRLFEEPVFVLAFGRT